MSFIIPDWDTAFSQNPQSIWMECDTQIIAAGFAGTGVVSGCAVTAQISPNMTVAVASGVVSSAGASVAVAAGNLTVGASTSLPRVDLVTVSPTGAKTITAGTAAVNPKPVLLSTLSGHVALAMVYVAANATSIVAGAITDKRIVIAPSAPSIQDLLTGDDSQFTASLGNWTNTGGTLSRDTSAAYQMMGFAASLKFVTTAVSQHADVPVAGTFLAGARYDFLALLKLEETGTFPSDELDLILGLQGTDTSTAIFNLSNGLGNAGAAGYYYALYGVWTPSANRTGVTLRLNRTAGTATASAHLGLVRVAKIANAGDIGLGIIQNPVSQGATEMIVSQPNLSFGATDNNFDPPVQFNSSPVAGGELSMTSAAVNVGTLDLATQLLAGTVDPTAGGGVAHGMPALYLRNNAGTVEIWTATGTGATAWQKVTIP